ncbi:hypothetical protein N7519_010914 [Penicillium mononematosum]|uniref:uncharacterized protein n=1 Tax=Penicillium mononematosum TaxID=268346 RepID=UPI0025471B24|nr:uncharacterized protein N7519_010914 [Penicillium mononematosum]KAJ6180453.1 hypothetical protein N7519_010914 [Penicillium mononematosum]
MASRFFYGSGSDSDSSSDEEEEVYRSDSGSEEDSDEDDTDSGSSTDSEEEGEEGRTGASKFLHDDTDSEESEEEEKVTIVKSAKDKRLEGLESTIRLIDNAQKINDWAVIATEFDNLNRQMLKITGPTPKIYIQAVAELEDFTNETATKQKASNKKMNASNSKGFNAVKQKIKKNNKEYATLVEKYRADKDAFMADEVEEKPAPAPAPKPTKVEKIENFAAAAAAAGGEDDGFATVGRGGKTLQYTPESILKHLRVIVESRGKKNTDRADQIRTMQKLLEVATTPYQRIRTYMTLISTRFDLTATSAATYMSSEQWQAANEEYSALLSVLEENRQFLVSEVADEWEDDEKQPTVAEGETFFIPGSVVSLVEHLDDSLTKGLREIDPHTSEYIERLTDEQALYSSLVRSQLYVESLKGADKNGQDSMNRLVIRRLEHIYFKPANVIAIVEQAKDKAVPTNIKSAVTATYKSGDMQSLVASICNYMFEHSDGIPRARAMLCQIYFLALHDQYYKSRDLMLMSHLTENIATFDVSTQILFNRTLVQIGLCAFRAGLIYEAQNTLSEICGSGRQKELLAQGIIMQRYSTVSPEQERLERQRQLPFHMHINLELLECVYLTSSALLEVPLMAQTSSAPELRRRMISKTFRRMLDYNERQVFTGPPENTRDGVIAGAKALAAGDWKLSASTFAAIKIWDLMPQPELIKAMLSRQTQEEGLRTYLFTYAPYYDSLSISSLATMFELEPKKIVSIISRMISHEELAAALDQVNDAIIFRKGVELSRLQSQIVTLADKSTNLLESNEKTLEQRTQGMANAFQREHGPGARGGRGGRGRGGGRGGARIPQGDRRPGGQQFGGGALGAAIKA